MNPRTQTPIEPEVLEQMRISQIEIPDFKDTITLEQYRAKGFSARDAEMLAMMNRLESQNKWSMERLVEGNEHMMRMEQEIIRQRMLRRKASKVASIFTWCSVTLGAGVIASFGKRLLEKYW